MTRRLTLISILITLCLFHQSTGMTISASVDSLLPGATSQNTDTSYYEFAQWGEIIRTSIVEYPSESAAADELAAIDDNAYAERTGQMIEEWFPTANEIPSADDGRTVKAYVSKDDGTAMLAWTMIVRVDSTIYLVVLGGDTSFGYNDEMLQSTMLDLMDNGRVDDPPAGFVPIETPTGPEMTPCAAT